MGSFDPSWLGVESGRCEGNRKPHEPRSTCGPSFNESWDESPWNVWRMRRRNRGKCARPSGARIRAKTWRARAPPNIGRGRGGRAGGRHIPNGAARVADGVIVRDHVGIETAGPRRERECRAQTGGGERVQRVVDGGKGHGGQAGLQAIEQLLRRRVALVGGELAHDGDSLRRELEARRAHPRQHQLYPAGRMIAPTSAFHLHQWGSLVRIFIKCNLFVAKKRFSIEVRRGNHRAERR